MGARRDVGEGGRQTWVAQIDFKDVRDAEDKPGLEEGGKATGARQPVEHPGSGTRERDCGRGGRCLGGGCHWSHDADGREPPPLRSAVGDKDGQAILMHGCAEAVLGVVERDHAEEDGDLAALHIVADELLEPDHAQLAELRAQMTLLSRGEGAAGSKADGATAGGRRAPGQCRRDNSAATPSLLASHSRRQKSVVGIGCCLSAGCA